MTGVRQGWLVARREIRERSRSNVFRAGIVITLALVVAAIVMAANIHPGTVTRNVGFTGTTPAALPAAVIGQGKAAGVTVRPATTAAWPPGSRPSATRRSPCSSWTPAG